MAYNLLIAYDLMKPGQSYEAVHARIKSLGRYAQLQFSLFYVHTNSSPADAYAHVKAAMDENDKLAVANVNNMILSSPKSVLDAINSVWTDQAA